MPQRSTVELGPPTAYQRSIMIAAVTFTAMAATLFVVILIVGGADAPEIGRVFSPVAIAATALGLIASIAALVDQRTRTLGITTGIVLVPCVLLAGLSAVALYS